MSIWRPLPSASFWKRWLPEWMHGPVANAFKAALALLLVLSAVAITYAVLSSHYDLKEVAEMRASTLFCDRDGEPLDASMTGSVIHASRSEMPKFLIQALLAREDARFYSHHGVDHRGLIRATWRNLRDFDFTQGASTLTMQLARNCFELRDPEHHGKLRELHRKLLEMAIAMRIESRFSKEEILTYYLNRIYFGAGCYGIARAAETYFGKSTPELSESECALLVGIIRGPHLYSPLRNLEGALEQRSQTLQRMQEMGFIDDQKRQQLDAEPVKLADQDQLNSQTSYLVMAVKRELEQVVDEETLGSGGLKVITTIDSAWQGRLERELQHAVEALEKEKGWKHPTHDNHQPGNPTRYLQYAAFTTETETGGVLALIGGRDFSHSRYDRSHAQRDLGSAFEPFVAAAAAENQKLVIPGKPLQTGRLAGVSEVQRVAKLCGLSGPFATTRICFAEQPPPVPAKWPQLSPPWPTTENARHCT